MKFGKRSRKGPTGSLHIKLTRGSHDILTPFGSHFRLSKRGNGIAAVSDLESGARSTAETSRIRTCDNTSHRIITLLGNACLVICHNGKPIPSTTRYRLCLPLLGRWPENEPCSPASMPSTCAAGFGSCSLAPQSAIRGTNPSQGCRIAAAQAPASAASRESLTTQVSPSPPSNPHRTPIDLFRMAVLGLPRSIDLRQRNKPKIGVTMIRSIQARKSGAQHLQNPFGWVCRPSSRLCEGDLDAVWVLAPGSAAPAVWHCGERFVSIRSKEKLT